MNQGGRQMEGRIPHEQRTIRTPSDVFRTIQFARNIPKNNEQYFLRITSQRGVGKLHGRLRHTSKDNGRIGRTNNPIFQDSGKTQSMF